MIPLINGIARSWSEIEVPFLGTPLSGIISLEWNENSVATMNMGIGRYASSVGYGNKMFTGAISFTQEEWNNIVRVSPNSKPTDLGVFDLPILYMNDTQGLIEKVLWKSVIFTDVKISPKQGDTMIAVEVTCIMADVQTTVA